MFAAVGLQALVCTTTDVRSGSRDPVTEQRPIKKHEEVHGRRANCLPQTVRSSCQLRDTVRMPDAAGSLIIIVNL